MSPNKRAPSPRNDPDERAPSPRNDPDNCTSSSRNDHASSEPLKQMSSKEMEANAGNKAASWYQDRVFRNLMCKRVQVDEIWAFVHCKQKECRDRQEGAGECRRYMDLDGDRCRYQAYTVMVQRCSSRPPGRRCRRAARQVCRCLVL